MQTGETDRQPTISSEFHVEVVIPAQDIQSQWRRCNMLANYLAEYSAYQFQEREWAENMISTIVNEFLEALVVLAPAETSVRVRCRETSAGLQIAIEHHVHVALVESYLQLLREVRGARLNELYFELLSATERPEVNFNQLGIAMLAHDFQAQIAAQYLPDDRQVAVLVTVPLSHMVPSSDLQ